MGKKLHAVFGECFSAGRLYDRISEKAVAKVKPQRQGRHLRRAAEGSGAVAACGVERRQTCVLAFSCALRLRFHRLRPTIWIPPLTTWRFAIARRAVV